MTSAGQNLVKEKSNNLTLLIKAYTSRAIVRTLCGDSKLAINDLEGALSLAEKYGYEKSCAECNLHLSKLYSSIGKYTKMYKCIKIAYNIYKKLHNKKGVALSLSNLGNFYAYLANHKKALKYHLLALQNAANQNNPNMLAFIFNNIGVMYFWAGDYQKARIYIMKSLRMREKSGDKQGLAMGMTNIGATYYYQGKVKEYISYNKQALNMQSKIGDKQGAAMSLNNIGLAYDLIGDMNSAFKYYDKSRGIFNLTGNLRYYAIGLLNTSHSYIKTGNYHNALEDCKKSLKILESLRDTLYICENLIICSEIYRELNKLEKARACLNRVEKFANKIKSTKILISLNLEKGELFLIESQQKDNQLAPERLVEAMRWALLVEEYAKREKSKIGIGKATLLQARIMYKNKKYQKSMKTRITIRDKFNTAIEICSSTKDRVEYASACYHYGEFLAWVSDFQSARKYLCSSKGIYSKACNTAYLEKIAQIEKIIKEKQANIV